MVYYDFNERPAKEPQNFTGFVCTVIAVSITATLYYFAGAFSCWFN